MYCKYLKRKYVKSLFAFQYSVFCILIRFNEFLKILRGLGSKLQVKTILTTRRRKLLSNYFFWVKIDKKLVKNIKKNEYSVHSVSKPSKTKMFTFTELQLLCAESFILKYSVYLLPLFVYLLTKYIWQKCLHVNNIEARAPRRDVNNDENIETDTKSNNEPDDEAYKPFLPEREHIPYKGITEYIDRSGDRFYKMANDRRSIRKFDKNRPVDFNVIQKCILAAGNVA